MRMSRTLLAMTLASLAGIIVMAVLPHSYGSWLQRDIRRLQHELPPSLPVLVTVDNTPGAFASTCKIDEDGDGRADRFWIRIDPGRDRVIAMDCLVHEWAHTLSWDQEEIDGDHCDAWGVAYAQVYRALLDAR